jgi:YegS/Rv2252/BmrU family lipid kinase
MLNAKRWFVIINPTSGNGASKRKWPNIKATLETENFDFDFVFTKHENHSIELVNDIVSKGFRNIICIGGDGTLHNIINGVQKQILVNSSEINVGVIPIGTGNDWIKTYNIPHDLKKAISIIKQGQLKCQDLGKIEFLNSNKEAVYFNNLAGIGFDGFVVSKVDKYKYLGRFAYIIGAIIGLFSFKNFTASIKLNNMEIKTKSLMVLVGLCKYSGGGMRLTRTPNLNDGLFDVTIAKDLNSFDVIKNLFNLYTGNIVKHSKVENHKTSELTIIVNSKNLPFVQADGELLGKNDIRLHVVPSVFSFYSN